MISYNKYYYNFKQIFITIFAFSLTLITSYYLKKNGILLLFPKSWYYEQIPIPVIKSNVLQFLESAKLFEDLAASQHYATIMNAPESHINSNIKEFFNVLSNNPELFQQKVKLLGRTYTYIILDQNVKDYFLSDMPNIESDKVQEYFDTLKIVFNIFESESPIKIRIIDNEEQIESCKSAFKTHVLKNIDYCNMNRMNMLNYNRNLTGAEIGAIAVIGTVAILGAVTIGVTVYNRYW